MMTQTNHGAKIPMPNHNLVEAPMHCSWCGEMLPLCECPANLARSIDKARAEAIRERNELREQLLAAREALTDIGSGELGINVAIRLAQKTLIVIREKKDGIRSL